MPPLSSGHVTTNMLAASPNKYGFEKVAAMTLNEFANPTLPWEVIFWTAR